MLLSSCNDQNVKKFARHPALPDRGAMIKDDRDYKGLQGKGKALMGSVQEFSHWTVVVSDS